MATPIILREKIQEKCQCENVLGPPLERCCRNAPPDAGKAYRDQRGAKGKGKRIYILPFRIFIPIFIPTQCEIPVYARAALNRAITHFTNPNNDGRYGGKKVNKKCHSPMETFL